KNILMFNNSRDAFGIAQKKLGYSQNTTDKKELDACAEELKKQKEVVQAYVMDEIFDKMENGDAAIAPYYAGDAVTMIENNPDLAFVVPKEGSNRFVDSMVIPKGTKNKAEAEEFINFMCKTDVAKANIEFIGYSTPHKAAYDALDREIKENQISYPKQEVLNKCESFKNLPKETNQYMEDLWVGIKAGSDS
ncbi:MAG: spermidine/putrescine transporter substrate-binding protein, partial [Oscillospiraceae bacterium]|nr:spermidine/putrescine transporter substrate-binding protein [Oscillospiraceae bacterium]